MTSLFKRSGRPTDIKFVASQGVACLKFNIRNCGDVVNAFLQMFTKREHLQIV